MRDAIVTLPISPVEAPHLGLSVMPFLMDVLGKSLNLVRILALNIQGLKYHLSSPQSEKARIAQSYLSSLAKLDISPDFIWRDNVNEFAVFAQTALTSLHEQGKLKIEKRSVLRCSCGKVEFLLGAHNFSLRRRIFTEVDGKRICKLCKSELETSDKEVCLFKINVDVNRAQALPSFACDELRMLMRSFIDIEFLVSRSRVTHFSWNLPGLRDFDMDPDFLWSLMVPHLYSLGYVSRYVVASRKNMLACFSIGAMAQTFGCPDPIFIFPPYLVGPRKTNVKLLGSVEQIISSYGENAVKAFIVSGLNWRITEAVADPTYLKYLSSLRNDVLEQAYTSIMPTSSQKIIDLSGFNLNRALRQYKKGKK